MVTMWARSYMYKAGRADETGAAFPVERDQSVVELARELLHSKAAASRVLAQGRLKLVPQGQLTQQNQLAQRSSNASVPLRPNDRVRKGDLVRLTFEVIPCDALANDLKAKGAKAKDAKAKGAKAIATTPHESNSPAGVSLGESLEVLYEDPFVLAVNKPAGILVHGDGSSSVTLTDLVRAYLLRKGSPAAGRVQALQRLDVETSGVVLFSKTKEFQPAFDELLRPAGGGSTSRMRPNDGTHGGAAPSPQVLGCGLERPFKCYLAVVDGRVSSDLMRINRAIGRDRHDARRMRVSASGKPSLTLVRGIAAKKGRSLVACVLETGRRHQIRVHLASIGHPIVGDPLYGRGWAMNAGNETGLMLHAVCERFVHPVTGALVEVKAPIPSRMMQLFQTDDSEFNKVFSPEYWQ